MTGAGCIIASPVIGILPSLLPQSKNLVRKNPFSIFDSVFFEEGSREWRGVAVVFQFTSELFEILRRIHVVPFG